METSTARFRFSAVARESCRFTWYHDKSNSPSVTTIKNDGRYSLTNQEDEYFLEIKGVSLDDQGSVYVKDDDQMVSQALLTVIGEDFMDVPFMKNILRCLIDFSQLWVSDCITTAFEFLMEIKDVTVAEGQCALFECEVKPPNYPVDWFINGDKVMQSSWCKLTSIGALRRLEIQHCSVKENGKITARLGNKQSGANLTIKRMYEE